MISCVHCENSNIALGYECNGEKIVFIKIGKTLYYKCNLIISTTLARIIVNVELTRRTISLFAWDFNKSWHDDNFGDQIDPRKILEAYENLFNLKN